VLSLAGSLLADRLLPAYCNGRERVAQVPLSALTAETAES